MAKQQAQTEIVVTPIINTALSTNVLPGVADDVDMSDVIIPRLAIVQKMSKAVDKFDAKAGEFRESITGQLLPTPVELVFFKFTKTWIIRHNGDFSRIEPVTPANANWQYKETMRINGVETQVTRDEQLNYYVMVAPVTIEALPLVWTLSSTSRKAGKTLNTLFMKLRRAGKSSTDVVVKCSVDKNENDKGTWFTPAFALGRNTTPEEKQIVQSWLADVERGAVQVSAHEDAPADNDNDIGSDDIPF